MSNPPAGDYGLTTLQKAFAVLFGLHGAIHVAGFMVPWRIGDLGADAVYRTTVMNGALDIGDAGVKAVGLVWLLTAAGMVAVAIALWRQADWARDGAVVLTFVSLVLCALGTPEAIGGLLIDAIILPLLVFIPALVVAPSRKLVRR